MAVYMWVGMAYVHVYTSVSVLGGCVAVDSKDQHCMSSSAVFQIILLIKGLSLKRELIPSA